VNVIQEEEPQTAFQLPIAGVVMTPFPCVILSDGQRLGQGAVVNGYSVDSISLTEVSLSKDKEKRIWRP